MSLFNGKFYDLNVHPIPEGADSITRFAYAAKKYGYSGIAIIDTPVTENDMKNKPENFSIYSGIQIKERPSKLRDKIRNHKDKTDVLIVTGEDEEINRAAVESEGLDILLQPVRFNHVLAKIASDNSVTLGFDIGSIVRYQGDERVRELSIMRKNLKFARKYDLSMVLTNNPYSCYDIRSPREMASMAGLFGMTIEEAVNAMSGAPLSIIRRKSRDYIQEGIEIICGTSLQ